MPTEVIQSSREFGVLSFLLTLVLVGVGIALWRLGGKLVDGTVASMQSLAESSRETGSAVKKISELAEAIEHQGDQSAQQILLLTKHLDRNNRALKHVVAAATEALPRGEFTEDQADRVKSALEAARRLLDAEH